jgi:hypothetical protein
MPSQPMPSASNAPSATSTFTRYFINTREKNRHAAFQPLPEITTTKFPKVHNILHEI